MTHPTITPAMREEAERLVTKWLHGDDKNRQWLRHIATSDLAKALAANRAAALEEAAEMARERCINLRTGNEYEQGHDSALLEFAVALTARARALVKEP